ncbi:MAG: hypothetical protein PHE55_18200 [Methylococcaceae bacterium]|nr:hypothetical protein [Methylococcaceae bacterium]
MSINSRDKGATGEREFARLLHEHLGVKLVRNLEQSRSGGYDLEAEGKDPTAEALGRFAIECKRYAATTPGSIAKWWGQAVQQAHDAERIPALAYRADRQEWRVTLPLSVLDSETFGDWQGIEWTAALSVPAFCTLIRERAKP